MTNESGVMVELTEHTPYGQLSKDEGSVNVDHKFTGQRLDKSTGLYYYYARYYDPQLGRFISPDTIVQAPSDPQTFNRYAYARNNPVRYVDPSGHFIETLVAVLVAGALIGGAIGAIFGGVSAAINGTAFWSGVWTGFASGAAAGAFAGVAAPLTPYIGAAIGSTMLAEMAVFGAVGMIGNGVASSMNGGSFFAGGATSFAIGAVTAGVGRFAGPALRPLGNAISRSKAGQTIGKILKPLTQAMQKYQAALESKFGSSAQATAAGPSGNAGNGNVSSSTKGTADGNVINGTQEGVPADWGGAHVRVHMPEEVGAAPDFVVTPKGTTIAIPDGARGPIPTEAPGFQYVGGSGGKGMNLRVDGVRIMDPTNKHQYRASYMNIYGQKVSPKTGQTISNSHPEAHIPIE